jgi:hypothetical protein
MAQTLTVKLQIRIDAELERRLNLACHLWAPKDETYTPSDVVRLVLNTRLPQLPKIPPRPSPEVTP